MTNYYKEGWTIDALMGEITIQINMIMNGESWRKPFKTKNEVKNWIADNLPNHLNAVAELTRRVCKQFNIK